jgi:hypothetical protein
VLIGDGPTDPPDSEKGLYAAGKYLSDVRVDYSPAVFFVNPFLYYSYNELQEMSIYHDNALSEEIPNLLGKYFKDNMIHTSQVYSYFRAAHYEGASRQLKKKERQHLLKTIFIKILDREFPKNKNILLKGISKEGAALTGEALRFNIYPFHFEEWVLDLLKKAKSS